VTSCTTGQTCSNGVCSSGTAGCVLNSDCATGQECSSGICKDKSTTSTFELGACMTAGKAVTLPFTDALTNFDCFRYAHIILLFVGLMLFSLIK